MKGDKSRTGIVAGGAVIMGLLIIPVPALLLDILIGLNLIFALLVLLVVLYVKKAKDFSLFPTIVLVSAIYSLLVNISAARLILTKGADFNGVLIRFVAVGIIVTRAACRGLNQDIR